MLRRVRLSSQLWSNSRCIRILYKQNYSQISKLPKMKMKIRIMASSLKMKMKRMMKIKMILFLQTNYPFMTQKSFAQPWTGGNFTKNQSLITSLYVAIFIFLIRTTLKTRSLSVPTSQIFLTPTRFSDSTKIAKGALLITSTIFLIMINGVAFMIQFRVAISQTNHCLRLN
jgi:hypothetical protein